MAYGYRGNVVGIELQSVNEPEPAFEYHFDTPTPIDNFHMSTLSSMKEATKLFKTQKSRTRNRSQCYNRAHVWTYELSKRLTEQSNERFKPGKVWMFFTKKYIREFRYRWWFHVTPTTKVRGAHEDIALDRTYTKQPTPLTDWKNLFIKNRAFCPTVKYYSSYRKNQWSHYCYLIKSSMYYWQPFNIENLEKGKKEKTEWKRYELKRAYRNALRSWNGRL
jgi:hypothetical protein